MSKLRETLELARSGEGRLLCVVGEAGIGKTTLIESFLDTIHSDSERCFVARGSCSERLAGSDGYLPFMEILSELISSDRRQRVAELLRSTAPSWYAQLLPTLTGTAVDSQLLDARAASQERMKREFVAFVAGLSRLGTMVICLDDLHWVDVSSADLLTYLASKSRSTRLLLLCSYRPTELARTENPFFHALLDLQTRGVCEELMLCFLTQGDVEQYIHLQFPQRQFPQNFAEVIHARTEGNALFLVDLVRFLQESGMIVQEDGQWVLKRPLDEIEQFIPDSVRNMVRKKTEQLDDLDRRLLAAASVQGAEFHAAVVAQTLGLDEWDVEERLEALARTQGLVRSGAEVELPDSTLTLQYAFVHVLYQNAFYRTLTPARRAKLSADVAQVLSSFYQSAHEDIVLQLAILFEAARDFTNAADCFLEAAENATKISANHEAVSLARRAIDISARLDREGRLRCTLAAAFHIARLSQAIGKFDDAIEAFDLAEQTATEADDVAARIEAICGKASTCFLIKQMDRTRRLGTDALQLAKEHHLDVGQAQAESVLASEHLCRGEFDQAERLYDRAIPLLKERGSLTHMMDASFFRFGLHAWRLEFKEFEAGRDWWLKQARKLGLSPVPMYFFSTMALGNQGRFSEALAAAQEGRRLAELNDDAYHICRLPNCIGWLYRELGDLEKAVSLDAESQKLGFELGFEEAEANSRVNLAHDFITLGELDRAFEQLTEAESLFERDVWFRWRYNIRLQAELARFWMAREDISQAEHYARASIELAQQSRARKHMAWGQKLLADVLLKQDRADEARSQLVAALRVLDGHPCPTIDWRISSALAEVARLQKNSQLETRARDRAHNVIRSLADSLNEDKLRARFLTSKSVLDAGIELS